jgi:ribosome-associated protein
MARIVVAPGLSIDEAELEISFIRASGPGGQNVNKVASAVQLRFDARRTRSLPEGVKVRLQRLARSRLTNEGVVVITAGRFRSQPRNREDALARLIALIAQAAVKPVRRLATKPSGAARRERVESKVRRGLTKAMRRTPGPE